MIMKIVYLFFILLQIFLSEINGFKRHAKWHRRSKHYEKYTDVTMPSGNRYSVITPQGSKNVCKQKSRLVEMRPNDKRWQFEYNLVQKEFEIGNQNGFEAQVVRVQKVFNPCLWSEYKYRQVQIGRDTNTMNERMLYHQSKVAHRIALEGFDERYTRKDGQFGAGIYFSDVTRNLICREKKRGQHCQALLSRVSLGKIYMETQQKRFAHPPVGSHSVTGASLFRTGQEFMIYRGEQAYPEYLITYTVKKHLRISPMHSWFKINLLNIADNVFKPIRPGRWEDLPSLAMGLGDDSLNG